MLSPSKTHPRAPPRPEVLCEKHEDVTCEWAGTAQASCKDKVLLAECSCGSRRTAAPVKQRRATVSNYETGGFWDWPSGPSPRRVPSPVSLSLQGGESVALARDVFQGEPKGPLSLLGQTTWLPVGDTQSCLSIHGSARRAFQRVTAPHLVPRGRDAWGRRSLAVTSH